MIENGMAPVVVRDGKFAVPESWLAARRDHGGFLSLEDATDLMLALEDAVNDEIARQIKAEGR